MKLKILSICLICIFNVVKIKAGCALGTSLENITLGWKHKFNTPFGGFEHPLYFNSNDVLVLRPLGQGCSAVFLDFVSFNDTIIVRQTKEFKFFAKAGKYSARTSTGVVPYVEVTFTITNSFGVGITESENLINSINVFPNPCKGQLNIFTEKEIITTAQIYSLNSELITNTEINNNSASIPIDNIPQGIYILKIATLSNKVLIKKLIVR